MVDQEKEKYYFAVYIEGEEAKSGPLVITQELKLSEMIEVEDFHFNHNSAVLLANEGALNRVACCYLHVMQNPSKLVLIAGHTDRSGSAKYNHWLSKKRGENLLYIMVGKRKEWVKSVCSEKGQPGTVAYATQEKPDGRSKVEDYQMLLNWMSDKFGWFCDLGKKIKDGYPAGPRSTKEAIETFQMEYNNAGIGKIEVNGLMNQETWGAFWDIYMLELAELMGHYKVVNGNQVPDPSPLKKYQNSLKFVDGHEIVNCGESHPITRKYKSRTDRRVEILFFDPAEKPKLDFYPDCHKDIDKECSNKEERIEAQKKADKCELFGNPGIYKKEVIPCYLDRTLVIEVLDYKGNHLADVKVNIEGASLSETGKTNANGVLVQQQLPEGKYNVYVDTQNRKEFRRFKRVKEEVEIKK